MFSTIKEKAMAAVIVLLVVIAVTLGAFYKVEESENEKLSADNSKLQMDLSKAVTINALQEAEIKQNEIDAQANQKAFDAKMAEKPKYKTQYRYVYSTDVNSSDVNATECKALMDLVDSYKAQSDTK